MVSFDSDNPTLAIPDFPVILSPEPGSTISPELVLTVEPGGFDNFVFLRLVPETEIEGVDFLEEATTRIAARGDKSESLALKPGRWGGDIATASAVSATASNGACLCPQRPKSTISSRCRSPGSTNSLI